MSLVLCRSHFFGDAQQMLGFEVVEVAGFEKLGMDTTVASSADHKGTHRHDSIEILEECARK